MKKFTSFLLAGICFCSLALVGCSSDSVYRLTENDGGDATAPVLRDHQTTGTLDLESGVAVTDRQKPRVLIKGDYSSGIEAASKYLPVPSVIAVDNCDNDPFLFVSATDPTGGKVQFTNDGRFYAPALGAYEFSYRCIDASGNASDEVSLSIEVKDTQSPQINLRSFVSGITGLRFNSVKIPSVLVSDYWDCDLKVEVGKAGGAFEEIDRYALVYKPQETGEYTVRYTATEESEEARVTVAEISLTVTEKTLLSGCEEDIAITGWGFSDPTATAKPTKALDTQRFTQGSGSTRINFSGNAAQTAVAADDGLQVGMTAYLDFLREGTDDVSGYQSIKIDVYNDSAVAHKARLWVMGQGNKGKYKAAPVELAPNAWTTLTIDIATASKTVNVEALLSVLISFEARESGSWSYCVDNFRVE